VTPKRVRTYPYSHPHPRPCPQVLYGADVLVADDIIRQAHKTWDAKGAHMPTGQMHSRLLGAWRALSLEKGM